MPLSLGRLPEEVLEQLATYLAGIHLFHLSHVNQHAFHFFSQRRFWRPKLISRSSSLLRSFNQYSEYDVQEALNVDKRAYMCSRTVYFDGQKPLGGPSSLPSEHVVCGGSVQISATSDPTGTTQGYWRRTDLSAWGNMFAFDVWFSVSRAKNALYRGGVLLGAQRTAFYNPQFPADHQQLIMVDSDYKLCSCFSSVSGHPVGVLEPGTWYHLALCCDGTRSQVYLNGKLAEDIPDSIGSVAMSYTQVGTGYVCGEESGCQTCSRRLSSSSSLRQSRGGWRSFTGHVNQFRLWSEPLTTEQVSDLADGKLLQNIAGLPRLQYSMEEHLGQKKSPSGLTNVVKKVTTSPIEKGVEEIQIESANRCIWKAIKWWE